MNWLTETPQLTAWSPMAQSVGIGVGVLLLVVVLVVARRRSGERTGWLSGIGPQALVALGGVAVSVHGLWGFATDTAELPLVLRVGFIATFDAAELVLLAMLYRTADPAVGWTRELRLIHRTAWTLVGFSAAMNAVHAPNWWSRPVLAAIPMLAAWLIELQLRAKLQGTVARHHDDEGEARPGPVRLVALLWQHAWAALFAALGLNASTSHGAISQAARVQRAARRCYELRLALEPRETLAGGRPRSLRKAQKRIGNLRATAQKAIDRADIATNTAQALAFARRLAALTRADDIARLDFTDAPGVLALLEDLNLIGSAARIEGAAHVAEAEAARERAEAARQEAENARRRAVDELADVQAEIERATAARQDLIEQTDRAGRDAQDARQRAEAARREADSARESNEAARLDADRGLAARREVLAALNAELQQVRDEVQRTAQAAQEARTQAAEARMLRDRICHDLAELHPGDGPVDPVWRSESKQAGWQLYLATLSASHGEQEPSAAQLADRFGIDPGNARNWLKDFRTARSAQLAAHASEPTSEPKETARV
ncbi:hypothetical protein [Streptomyces sp. B6B3]|uniref:hypothetical protein n=1 Tax=Streptomyces sp. B6B3 TaxID=3153570 RepID=UPI00325E47AD